MRRWYCRKENEVSGPFSLEELKFLQRRGKLLPNDMLRQGRAGNWMPARSVEALFGPQRSRSAEAQRRSTQPAINSTQPAINTTPAASEDPGSPSISSEDGESVAAAGKSPLPSPVPPLPEARQPAERPTRRVLLGGGIGLGVALMILLLLLFRSPGRDENAQQAAGREGSNSRGKLQDEPATGGSTAAAKASRSPSEASRADDLDAGSQAEAAADLAEEARSDEPQGGADRPMPDSTEPDRRTAAADESDAAESSQPANTLAAELPKPEGQNSTGRFASRIASSNSRTQRGERRRSGSSGIENEEIAKKLADYWKKGGFETQQSCSVEPINGNTFIAEARLPDSSIVLALDEWGKGRIAHYCDMTMLKMLVTDFPDLVQFLGQRPDPKVLVFGYSPLCTPLGTLPGFVYVGDTMPPHYLGDAKSLANDYDVVICAARGIPYSPMQWKEWAATFRDFTMVEGRGLMIVGDYFPVCNDEDFAEMNAIANQAKARFNKVSLAWGRADFDGRP